MGNRRHARRFRVGAQRDAVTPVTMGRPESGTLPRAVSAEPPSAARPAQPPADAPILHHHENPALRCRPRAPGSQRPCLTDDGDGDTARGAPATPTRPLVSRWYLHAVVRLDTGDLPRDPAALAALVATVRAQFDELAIPDYPIGLVQNCCIGRPNEVHVLDLSGGIVQHYRAREAVPERFAAARRLALHPTFRAAGLIPTYAFIEVLRDAVNRCARNPGATPPAEARASRAALPP